MMNSDQTSGQHAFVTFRVAGAALDPDDVTRILNVPPTHAHRNGEKYSSGPKSNRLIVGKTGVWYLSTDRLVDSPELSAHLQYVRRMLDDQRRQSLHSLLSERHLTAALTCFWHGRPNSKPPELPRDIKQIFESLPADIETDFATDDGG
jgi:hypothetical protein